jgi:hypothetical protein
MTAVATLIGDANRISGMTPTGVMLLYAYCRRLKLLEEEAANATKLAARRSAVSGASSSSPASPASPL